MRISIYIGAIAFILTLQVNGQNYIGLHKDEIASLMKETQRDFKLNTGIINKAYNYLKYEDKVNEQTLLFFLDEDDCCTCVRLMSDYTNLNDVTDTLNSKYTRTGENTWTYKEMDVVYTVRLEKEEWYFTVITKKEN
jgi:hypothetical protein